KVNPDQTPCAWRRPPARAAQSPEEILENRAMLRVAPALAARRADGRRIHRPNTHELCAAPKQAARRADGRRPNRPSCSLWNSAPNSKPTLV
ncbi:hypothetical protein A2U01_0052620, partial [Trifolium medium]|nr:hypothetical protein [Trifolium medium]